MIDFFSWVFYISNSDFLSFLSCLVWSYLSYLYLYYFAGSCNYVILYCVAFRLRLSEAFSWDLFGLGGSGQVPLWSILFIGWLTS